MIVSCPKCAGNLQIPDGAGGKTVRCPKCKNEFKAPVETQEVIILAQAVPPAPAPALNVPPPPPPSTSIQARTEDRGDHRDDGPRRERRSAYPGYDEEGPRLDVRTERPENLPGWSFALLSVLFLGLCTLAAGVRAVLMYLQWVEIDQVAARNRMQNFDNLAMYTTISSLVQGLVGIVATVFTCLWIYRAALNCRLFGARKMSFPPGWAVGWFFIPIANLIMPLLSTQEIWRASRLRPREEDPENPGLSWKRNNWSMFGTVWGIFWFLSPLATIGSGIYMGNILAKNRGRDPQFLFSQLTLPQLATTVASIMGMLTGLFFTFWMISLWVRQWQAFNTWQNAVRPDR